VFKGVTSSGVGVSGRISGGIVQVGEKVRVVPGDESATIRSASNPTGVNITLITYTTGIEKDENSVQWASAGSNVTIYLASIDPIHLKSVFHLSPLTSKLTLALSQYWLSPLLTQRRRPACFIFHSPNHRIRHTTTHHWRIINRTLPPLA
jgi:hypothetical protein